jgi:hypothetical protein
MAAMRAELTRLIWPAPTPMVCRPGIDDGVGLDELRHPPGEQQVAQLFSLGRAAHDLEFVEPTSAVVGSCTSRPPLTRL